MIPATLALADQAAAAAAHALTIMENMAQRAGVPVHPTDPGPVMQRIISRLSRRLLAGQVTLCPHLSWTAPQPASWAAWAPGRLRCQTCTATTATRVKGTREDYRCDACRRVVPRLAAVMIQLAPIVADHGTRAACLPPVAVHAGLCPACRDADINPKEK